MGLIATIFNEIVYRPIFNGLVFLYDVLPGHDFGIVIIVLTLAIKFILYPFSRKAIHSQKAIAKLQPHVKEIQKKHKDNKEQQTKALMELYQKHKVNPMSGCLPLLIQLPILFALYQVFYNGIKVGEMDGLYSFVSAPEVFNPMFLGFVDLSKPNLVLAILAGLFMFIQAKMMMVKKSKNKSGQNSKTGMADFSSMMNQQMTYVMPVFTIIIAARLPAALALYWIVSTVFSVVQQYRTKIDDGGENEVLVNKEKLIKKGAN